MNLKLLRLPLRVVRTARYLANLLVWSRVFVVKHTHTDINFAPELLAVKGVRFEPPQLRITDNAGSDRKRAERVQHGFNIVYNILFANLQPPGHLVTTRHALPGPAFAGVYLWDSAFIALIWRHWDNAVALEVVKSVVALRDGDRLQHVVADFVRSPFTQPPLIGWALARLAAERGLPQAELRALYESLKAYNGWLNQNRRLPSGLYFWQHPYESGVENAPRFSSRDERRLLDTTRLAAPDLCTYVVLQCEALSQLAITLREPRDAMEFQRAADEIRSKMNEQLWHEEDGLYYDRDAASGDMVRSRTIASLLPLAAGVAGEARARRLLKHICDASAFGSPIPLPSVALNDPDFEKDMWRGPVWINTAYLVLEGLARYGFNAQYGELAWKLCDGVFRVLELEHQVYEFYDPELYHTRHLNRKKGNLWKAITLGRGPQKDFVGWSGLVNTILIEGLIGYRRQGRCIRIAPCLPEAAVGLTFWLRMPQDACTVEIIVHPGQRYAGSFSAGGHSRSFTLSLGERQEFELPNPLHGAA